MSTEGSSYREIVRTSSIMGGAAALNYAIGMLRVKIVAVLLGPTGVGALSLYTSAMGLVGTVTGLGIANSAVREIARASSQEDEDSVAEAIVVLRRACWATGLLGWIFAVLLAKPLSNWLFGSPDHKAAISLLGVTLLLSAVSAGQLALLQGLRRIGDVAQVNVLSTLFSTIVAVGLYAWLGEAGIVSVMIVTAMITLAFSYWFSSRIHVRHAEPGLYESLRRTREFCGLGFAFLWAGVLGTGLDLFTRSIITRKLGVDSAGVYQAAWAISGIFGNFILSAMGADYFPRLSAGIHDKASTARLVNEQTEIGILLALPGLLCTLAFAPLIMMVFYSKSFLSGADLLPWFVLGVFAKVVSFPLGFIQLAKGASRLYLVTETIIIATEATLVFILLTTYGLIGASQAFALTYILYTFGMLWVARGLIGFSWSSGVKELCVVSVGFISVGLFAQLAMPDGYSIVAGGMIALAGAVFSLRELVKRLDSKNPLARWLGFLPGIRRLFG